MQIRSLVIKNFKSIRELVIDDIESALILVGKNNTGKTVVLDAIRAVTGDYAVRETDFNEKKQNIRIKMVLAVTEEDLHQFHTNGIVSTYKKYALWKRDFEEKLPSFCNKENESTPGGETTGASGGEITGASGGSLTFVCTINRNGQIRYEDGVHKNNRYIPKVLPRLHVIDTSRNLDSFQEDLFLFQKSDDLMRLHSNVCMFDAAKACNHCFRCIGLMNQKKPEDLQLYETARLLEYKMYQLNLSEFSQKVNENYRKNGGAEQIRYTLSCDMEQMFRIKAETWDEKQKHVSSVNRLGNGMKSIYMLSLLETYIEGEKTIPSILIVEYPELFLHPSLQKTASRLLYRLSKKNQIIFTTHSPNMVANFTKGQICQIVLDEDGYSTANQNADIDDILNDIGYSANDFLNVDFVFIVEGKQDKTRFPLLLEKYYPEVHDKDGGLSRIAIITTNSCTNIKTYANLKYMNQLYLRDQFLMIRDGDGKDPEELAGQLCHYYSRQNEQDIDKLPRVRRQNVLILKYYSFENYFLNPKVMAQLGVVASEEEFWDILFAKWNQYLYRLSCGRHFTDVIGQEMTCIDDLKAHFEQFKIYMRGHNLYDIFYGRFREQETELFRRYLELAPREDFADILEAIDAFVYFDSRSRKVL